MEFLLTGQTDFSITTSDFQKADTIDNMVQAKMVLKEMRAYLSAEFQLQILCPVILNLSQPKTYSWKDHLIASRQHLGNYSTRWLGERMSHEINIIPGLERRKFKAVLAHELTHAYQAEEQLMRSHGGFREGMSRWIEYHVLKANGLNKEADKLRGYRSFILGRSVVTILEYEKKYGRQATLEWLEKLS